jgi:hypothetical protein
VFARWAIAILAGESDPVKRIAPSSGTSQEGADPVPTTAAQEAQLIAVDRAFAAEPNTELCLDAIKIPAAAGLRRSRL